VRVQAIERIITIGIPRKEVALQLSAELIHNHLEQIRQALPFLMQSTAQMAGYPGAKNGLMLLEKRHDAEALLNVHWVNAENVPTSDSPIPEMAAACRPGDVARMTVVIHHGDGGRSGYLISPMVNWRQFTMGYAVLAEAHFPPGPPEPPKTGPHARPNVLHAWPAEDDQYSGI
jgi:hypothetical protein